ncbi:MAG: SDR family oxidoreductase [Opitutae bacterium]|nr:SDR family oxidoreductase [Opitutae bacterium]MBC9888697.1 SDR family oxidoreductase [Opitutae bacterium]
MTREWKDQVAIITGGASGIGFAVASKLHSLGVQTVLLDLDSDGLEKAKLKLDCQPLIIPTDVSEASSVNAAIRATMAKLSRIDILFNSAGIAGQTNLKGHEVDADDFDRVYRINLKGSFLMCKAVIPHMLMRNYGRILLVASISGKEGNAGMTAYSTSKAGVIGLTKTLGKDYADTGITVNALAPAVIRTPILGTMPQEQIDYMTEKIPMSRCGTLSEVASMATFILSPEASFTTGFCFDLSGGRATY